MYKKDQTLRRAIALTLGTTTIGAFPQASAQSPAPVGALEEIVVTARKRGEELLQNTPLSIRALTSDTLQDAGIQQFEDWARMVPGITFKDLGPGEKTIVTRGLVSTGAATTAVYFDETNITAFNDGEGGGRNVDIKLFDIDRVDVLRGPQGTIYGASALGGVIRIETAKPDLNEFSGAIKADIGYTASGAENYSFNGHVNIPIIEDVLGLRLVAWNVDNSGFIDNIRLGRNEINDEQTSGFRAIARYVPSDRLTLTASATVQNQEIGDGVRYNRVGDAALVYPGEQPFSITGDLQNSDFTVNERSDDPRIYSLTADYDFKYGNIVATTNLYDREVEFNFDSTPILLFFGVPIKAISSFPEEREIWSNEIRFNSSFDGPLQVLAGVFHQEEKIDSASRVFTVDNDGLINEPSPSVLWVVRDREFDETAVFGEVSFDVTSQWNLTVGARYAEFDFVTDEEALVPFFGPPTGPEPTKTGSDSTDILRFNTSYQISDDHMVYATASEGFRRGGLNLNAFGALFDIPETFGSDSLWNYEIGAKTSWFDRRLTVNATLYRLDWSDIQVETVDELGGIEYFANAGEAQVDGVELEVFARPISGLDITATLGWTRAELTEDPPPPSNGLDGDEINNVPEWTASLSAQYTWPVFSDFDGFVRADMDYTDGSNTRIAGSRDPFNVALESYELVNLRAGIENESWRITAYADNVFDEITQNDAINEVTNILAYFTTQPRTIGVNAEYRF
ncbi:TonB-dependent receptor [Luminiphilus syltensis NOR5-1B]|uniref:TonB-dependent receptor n=1 Tax=Luminiphilus syltensis NOR5-1B TaxID=565045 RepID=B8KUC6_9GAMM|nr:TonB-dependent receptor [Luminiphilus syltensis]EED36464.1 TonB-dependent receptor [Luminiphilus syltensis NOR5-1B]